jgi:lipoate-protein ligase A
MSAETAKSETTIGAYPRMAEDQRVSTATWRLLIDGDHSGPWNMALDEAILDAVAAGLVPPTLRVYGWEETSVTIGRFQDAARSLQLDMIQARDIPVVRRPTGGRGILHGGDVTVSVIVPVSLLGVAGSSVSESYRLLSRGFTEAFNRLGVGAELGRCVRRPGKGGDCFAVQSRADVISVDGQKIVGSAQRRTEGVILQQSSVRYRPADVEPGDVFQGLVADEAYPLARLEEEAVIAALVDGFKASLGSALNPGSVTAWEEERAGALLSHGSRAVVNSL